MTECLSEGNTREPKVGSAAVYYHHETPAAPGASLVGGRRGNGGDGGDGDPGLAISSHTFTLPAVVQCEVYAATGRYTGKQSANSVATATAAAARRGAGRRGAGGGVAAAVAAQTGPRPKLDLSPGLKALASLGALRESSHLRVARCGAEGDTE